MNRNPEKRPATDFHPVFTGCVGRDLRLARLLQPLYFEALTAIADNTYRSLIAEPLSRALSDLFDAIAVEELSHFRMLGELMTALGGNPAVRFRVSAGESSTGRETPERMLAEALAERRQTAEHYRALMAQVQDRVVYAVLSCLLEEERQQTELLLAAMP